MRAGDAFYLRQRMIVDFEMSDGFHGVTVRCRIRRSTTTRERTGWVSRKFKGVYIRVWPPPALCLALSHSFSIT
jgi:hypothetical protein